MQTNKPKPSTQYLIHTSSSAPEGAREILAQSEKAYGFLPNLLGIMAEAPALLKGYRTLMGVFEETSFTPTERQIVLLTVSYENGCEYCVSAHSAIAQMQKVPGDVIAALRDGTPIANPKLEALRAFTAAVVTSRGWPDASITEAFFAAGYTRAQAFEAILGVGVKTVSNYTNHFAQTPLDPQFAGAAWTKAK